MPQTVPVATTDHRQARRAALLVLVVLGAFCVAATTMSPAAQAANVSVAQCNDQNATALGATTAISCTVTIVNTISGSTTTSTVTSTRLCLLGPCPPGNGTVTTTSTDLVTRVEQCNGSGNDAAARITCTVEITNNIGEGTPGAEPVTDGTIDQCVGSAQGGGGSQVCDPDPASTTGATVTQCNGSGNGGGGTVACTVGALRVSPAIPVTVNQCNGTGNPGGSVVTCRTTIRTNLITGVPEPTVPPVTSPEASPTTAPASAPASASATTTASAPGRDTSASASPGAGPGPGSGPDGSAQVTRVPTGGVQAGGGSTAASEQTGLLRLGGAGLFLAALIVALLRPRVERRG